MNDEINTAELLKRIADATERLKLKVEEVEDYRFRIVPIDDYTEQALDALAAMPGYLPGERQQNLAILVIHGLELTVEMEMGEPGLGLEKSLRAGNPKCVALHEDSVALLQKELRRGVDRIAAHQGIERRRAVHAATTLALASHLADGLAVPARSVVH